MGFINFLAYVKHLGKNALVFFPSKTDHIAIASPSGEATEEMLSERLEKIQNRLDNSLTHKELEILLENGIQWEKLKAEKTGYMGTMQNKYGIPYNSLETGTYWLLLQNGAIVEYFYNGDHSVPDATILYKKIPDGYTLCGCGNNMAPYGTGYIYYATDVNEKNCPDIKIVKRGEEAQQNE